VHYVATPCAQREESTHATSKSWEMRRVLKLLLRGAYQVMWNRLKKIKKLERTLAWKSLRVGGEKFQEQWVFISMYFFDNIYIYIEKLHLFLLSLCSPFSHLSKVSLFGPWETHYCVWRLITIDPHALDAYLSLVSLLGSNCFPVWGGFFLIRFAWFPPSWVLFVHKTIYK